MSNRHRQTKRSSAWKSKALQSRSKNTMDTRARKLFVPPEPPSVNPSPWIPATVARLFTCGTPPMESGLVQALDIVNWLVDQVDPDQKYLPRFSDQGRKQADVNKPIYFRLESIMVWNLTGKTVALNALDLQTGDVHQYDAEDEDYESLGSWFDSCSGNSPPRVGFRWPTSNRQKILSNHKNMKTTYGEGVRHICNILAPKGDQIMVHFRIFWRFPATGKEMLASIIGLMDVHSAVRDVEQAVKTRASLGMQKKIYNQMPSKIPVIGAANVWVANKIIPTSSEGTTTEDQQFYSVQEDAAEAHSSCSFIDLEEIEELKTRISALEGQSA